jgi:hypothetical protein
VSSIIDPGHFAEGMFGEHRRNFFPHITGTYQFHPITDPFFFEHDFGFTAIG